MKTGSMTETMAAVMGGVSGLVILVVLAGPALSAPKAPAQAPIVQTVINCRKVEDAAQRLACYDTAVDDMAQAQAKGDLVTTDRQQRQAIHRQAFGLNLPSLSVLYGDDKEGVDRLTAKIASGRVDANGRWIIVLDDGAVWRQIDDNALIHPPHAGSTAEIRHAALGSFFMNVDGQLAIRVHRDN